jgi:TonB family protein
VRSVLAAIGVVALAAGSAWAQQGGPGGSSDVVSEAKWSLKPSGREFAAIYPDRALDRSVSGRATVQCVVRLKGNAEDCVLLSEMPYGMGFGDAALKLIRSRPGFTPRMVNGKPVDRGGITLPIVFVAPTHSARYVIYDPIWAKAPSFDDMAAAWPASAGAIPSGSAVLRCSMRASGQMRDCRIAADSSPDRAFGRAAQGLADRFTIRANPDEAVKFANSDVAIAFTFLNPASVEGRGRTISDPKWITSVKAEKVLEVFPPQAAELGVKAGRGVADCLVAADGKLTDCQVAREKPADLGFGASAVAIARLMQVNPWTNRGRPAAGARIKLPVDFNLAPEAAPAE